MARLRCWPRRKVVGSQSHGLPVGRGVWRMAILRGRKQLLFWIPTASIAVTLIIAVYMQVRHPPAARRALYIVGNPEKGSVLFYGSKQCGICHAVNGSGGRVAPDLSGQHPQTPPMGWLVSVLW